MKIIVEPSGAVSLASLLHYNREYPEEVAGKKIGLIISGGNIDLTDFFNNLKKSVNQ